MNPRTLEPLNPPEKIYILSLGCPKNQVDSEVMAGLLAGGGYEITSRPGDAGIILVNTCAFILPAKEEAVEEILRMAEWKKRGTCRKLVVAGCLPQRYGRTLREEMPEVDLFLGTGGIPRIVDLIRGSRRRSGIGKPGFLMNAGFPRLIEPSSRTAYLKIAEGCSNRCAYCAIPTLRGPFRSRPVDDILKEADRLAGMGIREMILIAQDTTAFGRDLKGRPTLSMLLGKLASIRDVRWIRLLYTYPASITDELLEAVAAVDKMCEYIDMPVQHIDDEILRSMRRKGSGSEIHETINRVRRIIPRVVLRTSLIAGFPGETETKFNGLLRFVEETRFENLGVFPYSKEEGTDAADLPFHVSERIKKRRTDVLMERQATISFEINRSRIGSVAEVLLESESGHPEFPLLGRGRGQAPEIDGVTYVKAKKGDIGEIILCRITDADTYDLYAEEISIPSPAVRILSPSNSG